MCWNARSRDGYILSILGSGSRHSKTPGRYAQPWRSVRGNFRPVRLATLEGALRAPETHDDESRPPARTRRAHPP
jgi:hypothetical protein